MKLNKFVLLPVLATALTACGGSSSYKEGRPLGYDKYTVSFMLNYRKTSTELPSGAEGATDNLLYVQQDVELNSKITAPEVNPIRINYDFRGWFKEEECLNPWNFENDTVTSSLFLYAKWGQYSSGGYVEPEYVVPEKIITDENYRLTGILNMPVDNNNVRLSTAAILRLKKNKSNVSFALNCERRESVTVTSATFDEETMKINVVVSSGEEFVINVIDKSASLSMATINATFEKKATAYEVNDAEAENYHIMLAGSSSMEYWTNYKEDLDPIVAYNHGIGGTTVEQWTDRLAERLVFPYSPKAVVYYVGVNNIINGTKENGTTVGRKVEQLFDKTHEHLPNTHVFYVLINKLPGYESSQEEFDACNQIVNNYCSSKDWCECIDAGAPLLKPNGKPNAAYFRTDGLHMSLYGYVLWGNEIRKTLINWLG